MCNKVLSIVIPTYNMEKYLARCIDSLVTASSILDDLDIIIVNDGSKDSSSKIAHEYESQYPQSIRVIDKPNGNYGSCINAALKVVSGKYVKVLDADDWFNTYDLVSFVQKLRNLEVDLVLTNFTKCFLGKSKRRLMAYPFQDGRIYDNSLMKDAAFVKMQMHAVAFRAKILSDNRYFQTEGISYTDQEWILYPMQYVNTIAFLNLNLYQYLLGREGQTMDSKVMMRSLSHHVKIAERMADAAPSWYDHRQNSPQADYCIKRTMLHLCPIYKQILNARHEEDSMDLLSRLDAHIAEVCPALYEDLDKSVVHRLFPVKSIHHYHKTGSRPSLLVRSIFRLLKCIQNRYE